jgi:hypothetical protein
VCWWLVSCYAFEPRSRGLPDVNGNWRLNEISQLSIEKYKRQRLEGLTIRKTPRSPTSVNREIELFSRIFTFAIDMGFANSNPYGLDGAQ